MPSPSSSSTHNHGLLQLSQLLRVPVESRSGQTVGRVDDVIVRLRGQRTLPIVSGIVAIVGNRRIFIGVGALERFGPNRLVLATNEVDLRWFERRDGEVLLRSDVLGHRLVDVSTAELVRAYDVELNLVGDDWVLTRLDTRRPSRMFGWRRRSDGHAARDWAAFEPLIGHGHSMAVRRVTGRIGTLKPAQLADLLEHADAAEGGEILEWVRRDPELEADVFEELIPAKASRLLDDMPDAEVAALLGRMRADDAADAIVDLRQARRRRVLDLMPGPQRTKVTTLMGFNPRSAGGLMNTDVASCSANASAGEALSMIANSTALQPEALFTVYVLGERASIVGAVSVIRLVQAEPAVLVDDLMDHEPVRVTPDVDLADIALLMADYNLYSIPVVGDDDGILGVVTVDDVLEATIPDDWRRREPAGRPTYEPAPVSSGSNADGGARR